MELKQVIKLIADENRHIDISGASDGMVKSLISDVAQALRFIFRTKGVNAWIVPPDFPISQAPI